MAAAAVKTDFKRSISAYSAPHGDFEIIDVPDLQFLMVDGTGDPNSAPAYLAALETLYPVAYRLKFASKRQLDRDYVVPPLEGLWWAEDMNSFTISRDKSLWRWTMMLMTPDWISAELFEAALEQLRDGSKVPPCLAELRLETLREGSCVQTLHIGPYDEEGAILEQMHSEFIPGHNLLLSGRHHEIYLNDPRRVAPAKLRTILRQPVTMPG